jgi:Restriction endonuclease
MLEKQPDPKKYEEYTSLILNDSRVQDTLTKYIGTVNIKVKSLANLGLEDWNLRGKKTGCIWNVDGFGYDINGERVLIECKHSSSRKIEQNELAAFTYIIQDVGAKTGIIVTTLGLQSGAKQIAKSENIGLVVLDYNSTDKNFKITFNTLDKPTQENPSHSIMALTDEIHI